MKLIFSTYLALWCLAYASALPSDISLLERTIPDSPNSYAPTKVDCPATRPAIRPGTSLSPQELQWRPKRQRQVIEPMKEFLDRMNIPDFDSSKFIDGLLRQRQAPPNIGIAIAGGGYRAMLAGAGVLAAFDSRVSGTTDAGGLGGLLQSSTAISALSGGSWLVGSLYANNFTSVEETVATTGSKTPDSDLWQLNNDILRGPPSKNRLQYLVNVVGSVKAKADAGFQVTPTDLWSRMLAFQLINATEGGPAHTWSSIATDENFANGDAPLPFILANGRTINEIGLPSSHKSSMIFEFTPWELGSFNIAGFAPLKYIGSEFEAGNLSNDAQCVVGFDNAGLVMGTSSSLFNQFVINVSKDSGLPRHLAKFLTDTFTKIAQASFDVAAFKPNPFHGFQPQGAGHKTNPFAERDVLPLVDSGPDGQSVPFYPLIHPERGTDVIFAFDAAGDTKTNWPDGSAIVATYERAVVEQSGNSPFNTPGVLFPPVPDKNTFVNKGFNNRPVFFGCDAGNMTEGTPLVVYIPNSPYSFNSNTSTFDRSYTNEERDAMITNGLNMATQGNGTRPLSSLPSKPNSEFGEPSNWPVCVACAVLSRSLDRASARIPAACQECFKEYCWDGSTDTRTPSPYDPKAALSLPPSSD